MRSRSCTSLLSSASSEAASLAAAAALARGVLVGPAVAASAGVSAAGVLTTSVSIVGACDASWAPRYARAITLSTQQESSATTIPIRAGLRFKRLSYGNQKSGPVPLVNWRSAPDATSVIQMAELAGGC